MLSILLFLKNLNYHKVSKPTAGDGIRIAKYANYLSKGYTEKWSKEMFCD